MSSYELVLALVSTTLLILLLITGIALAFFISGRQRIQQQVILAETKLAFEKELRTVETEVSESVMTQFAQELHDNIGQLLTALHIQVENQKLDHPTIAESFKPAEIYIAEINQQLRMLSRTLNKDYLGNIGLLAAIQLETERLRALKRFHVHYDKTEGISNLEKNQELMVFRIFQEIIQNALRHSAAKNLFITIDNSGGGFVMSVRDDGKGFDKEGILQSSKASGLRNIQKRAKLAGLDLEINSQPGKGSLFIMKKNGTLA
jgi:two-component system NarL family sensor kinase